MKKQKIITTSREGSLKENKHINMLVNYFFTLTEYTKNNTTDYTLNNSSCL